MDQPINQPTDQERLKLIDELLRQAVELEGEALAEFLDRACAGDAGLRHEVEHMLGDEIETGEFLKHSPVEDFRWRARADALTAGAKINHYIIESSIGRGGMGEVYLARDEQLQRQVAIKILPPEFSADSERVRRFEQEALTVSALNHPNIITIHEVGQSGPLRFIVTEFIEGRTLRDYLRESGGARSWREAVLIAEQIAGALSAAHTAGVIHRDIKPENVMIQAGERVKVLDFGVAKRFGAAMIGGEGGLQPDAGIETRLDARVGTLKYMSPEQARGELLDGRTDLFSLGLALYEMIAGRHPYGGKSDEELIVALESEDEIPPVSAVNDRIPAALDRIVSKSLRKNRDERYESAGEMLAELEELKSLAEVVHKEKGERLFKTRNANQLLTQFAALYDADKTSRIPLGSLLMIWRFADLRRGALEREVAKKSLLGGLARAGLWILLVAAMTIIVIAPMSVVEVWGEQMVRDGHASAVRRVAFSPDGRLLATSGVDRQVIIWNFAQRERVETLAEHADTVGALAFSPDGKWLVTGDEDGRLIVWDTTRWRKVKETHFPQGSVSATNFSPDGSLLAISIYPGGYTMLWQTGDWREVGRIPAGVVASANLLFTPDGRRLIFAGDDDLPCGWDVTTGKPVGPSLKAERYGLNGALSPDGALLVSIDSGGMVRFIDLAQTRLLSRQQAHNFYGRTVAFSPDGRLVATGSRDIVLWEAATQRLLARLEHTDNVWSLSFSPDGRWLVSTHGDGAILLWDVAARRRAANFSEHSGPVRKVIFSPDGKSLVSGGDDQSAIFWDRASLRKQAVLTDHGASVRELIFPAQPGLIATVDGTATVRLWDIARRQPQESPRIRTPENDGYPLISVLFPPDLRWNVTTHAVYERASGRMVCDNEVVAGNEGGFAAAAFSSDGQRLIGIVANGQVSLLESGTWRVLAQRQAVEMNAIRVCFSPDGELLAIGDFKGQVWLWSVNPLQSLAQLGRHETHVEAVAFSPDGRRVASASDDRTICLWDVGGRRLITRVGTHTSPINSIAFSPDGRQLLSGEHDGTVRLYTRRRTLWGLRLD